MENEKLYDFDISLMFDLLKLGTTFCTFVEEGSLAENVQNLQILY